MGNYMITLDYLLTIAYNTFSYLQWFEVLDFVTDEVNGIITSVTHHESITNLPPQIKPIPSARAQTDRML